MSIDIRPMVRSDLDEVLALWLELMRTGEQVDPQYRLHPDAAARARGHIGSQWVISRPFPGCLVACVDTQIIGFVSGTLASASPVLALPELVQITDLFVSPGYRRRGIARSLVNGYLAQARAAGFPMSRVATLYLDDRARRFWESLGFTSSMVTLIRDGTHQGS